jgi:hypothetical protein
MLDLGDKISSRDGGFQNVAFLLLSNRTNAHNVATYTVYIYYSYVATYTCTDYIHTVLHVHEASHTYVYM